MAAAGRASCPGVAPEWRWEVGRARARRPSARPRCAGKGEEEPRGGTAPSWSEESGHRGASCGGGGKGPQRRSLKRKGCGSGQRKERRGTRWEESCDLLELRRNGDGGDSRS